VPLPDCGPVGKLNTASRPVHPKPCPPSAFSFPGGGSTERHRSVAGEYAKTRRCASRFVHSGYSCSSRSVTCVAHGTPATISSLPVHTASGEYSGGSTGGASIRSQRCSPGVYVAYVGTVRRPASPPRSTNRSPAPTTSAYVRGGRGVAGTALACHGAPGGGAALVVDEVAVEPPDPHAAATIAIAIAAAAIADRPVRCSPAHFENRMPPFS
jgi:hypothetical protein